MLSKMHSRLSLTRYRQRRRLHSLKPISDNPIEVSRELDVKPMSACHCLIILSAFVLFTTNEGKANTLVVRLGI